MLTETQRREVWKDVNSQLGDARFYGIARDKHEIFAMIVAADEGRLTYPFSPLAPKTVEVLEKHDPGCQMLYAKHTGEQLEPVADQPEEDVLLAIHTGKPLPPRRKLSQEEKEDLCRLTNVAEEESDRLLHDLILQLVKAKGV